MPTASQPAIYVDFDDVLCRTADAFLPIVAREFGRRYVLDEIRTFNLRIAFALTESEYERLMDLMHHPDVLSALRPMPGAVETLRRWRDEGARLSVVTGRPPASAPAGRAWLERHGLGDVAVLFVDKYGRAATGGAEAVTLEDLAGMRFDLAVEDAPEAVTYLAHRTAWPIAVFDRPWNRQLPSFAGRAAPVARCADWSAVADLRSDLRPPTSDL